MRAASLACLFAFLTPACGNSDEAKAERTIELLEELDGAAKAAGVNCAKVAGALKAILDSRDKELEELAAWRRALALKDERKYIRLSAQNEERRLNAAKNLAEIWDRCSDHPAYESIKLTLIETVMM